MWYQRYLIFFNYLLGQSPYRLGSKPLVTFEIKGDSLYLFRLVELEKLRLATRKEEEKFISDAGVDPFVVIR